jgi:hypothetical protein
MHCTVRADALVETSSDSQQEEPSQDALFSFRVDFVVVWQPRRASRDARFVASAMPALLPRSPSLPDSMCLAPKASAPGGSLCFSLEVRAAAAWVTAVQGGRRSVRDRVGGAPRRRVRPVAGRGGLHPPRRRPRAAGGPARAAPLARRGPGDAPGLVSPPGESRLRPGRLHAGGTRCWKAAGGRV